IPASTVENVVGQLIEDGEVLYPFFGVESLPVTDVIVAQANLSVDYGQVVIAVSDDSPAEDAGIEPGDVITEIDGLRIDSVTPFIEALFNYGPGDTIPVTIQRGEETIEIEVTLAERPA
ncbi:MAG: PDZ domain-containing protein, partial [Thermomicrobiales bacterium]